MMQFPRPLLIKEHSTIPTEARKCFTRRPHEPCLSAGSWLAPGVLGNVSPVFSVSEKGGEWSLPARFRGGEAS